MEASRRAAAFAIVACAVGCTPRPEAPPPKPPVAVAARPAPPEPDLSPVPAPSERVLVARVQKPETLVETLASWAGLPLELEQVLPGRFREAPIVWEAPVEAVAVLSEHRGRPVLAGVISVGLRSTEEGRDFAESEGLTASRVAPGVFRLSGRDGPSCAIAASVGPTSARLVCGEAWSDVDQLLPYATRGLPNEDLGTDDLTLRAFAAPLQRRFRQEIDSVRVLAGLLLRRLQRDEPHFDRELSQVIYALSDEARALALDAESLELVARLDRTGRRMELEVGLSLSATSSFTAQVLSDLAQRGAPPSEAFWALPGMGSSASYLIPQDRERMAPIFTKIADLVDAYLESRGVSVASRRAPRELLQGSLTAAMGGGGQVSGALPVPSGATRVQRLEASLGWTVGYVQVAADRATRPFFDLARVLGDKRLFSALDGDLAKAVPKLTHRVVRVPGVAARATAFKMTLPPPWVDVLLDDGPSGADKNHATKGRSPSASLTFLMVPEGESTLFAISADEAECVRRLSDLHAGRGKKLSDLAELSWLREKKLFSGGYTSLESLSDYLTSRLGADRSGLFQSAPYQGRSLWPSAVSAERRPGGGVLARWAMVVPGDAFADLAVLIPSLVFAGSP